MHLTKFLKTFTLPIYLIHFQLCLTQTVPLPSIQFYSNRDCTGNPVRNDQGNTVFPLAQYPFKSYNYTELWTFHPCNTSDQNACNLADILIPSKGIGVCFNEDFQGFSHLHLARKSDDLVQDKINFYSGPYFNGIHDSLTNDQIRKNLTFESFFFSGNHSWTIYDKEEYQGTGYCVRTHRDVINDGYGVTLRIGINFTMGSLRSGCHSDTYFPGGDEEVTQPPRTTPDGGDDGKANSMSAGSLLLSLILAVSTLMVAV